MFIERLMILIRNPPISQSEGEVPCQPLPPELPTGADLPVDQLARARLAGGAAAMAHKEWEGTAHSGRSLHPYLRTNLNCGLTSLSVKPPENSGSRYGSMWKARWLRPRPAGSPEASFSVKPRRSLRNAPASLGQSAAWDALRWQAISITPNRPYP